MRTTVVSDRMYTGFDRRLIPNEAEVIAVALVVGDVVVFHLDGPEAVAEVRRYLEYEIEDGARLVGVYRREPNTIDPLYHRSPATVAGAEYGHGHGQLPATDTNDDHELHGVWPAPE